MFRRLFGGATRGASDLRTTLDEARGDERRLRIAGTRHRASFRHGGELHAEYRAAWRETTGLGPATPSGDVHLARWEDYPDPSVRDVVDLGAATDLPYLLVRTDDQRAAGGAGGELEALEQLESESDVVMVLIGDADIVVRRSFLLDLLDLLDGDEIADARDVVPELTDLANARGMRVTLLPG